MALKKRDLYFFLILLSFVGFAVYQRISEQSKKIKTQQPGSIVKEASFVLQSKE